MRRRPIAGMFVALCLSAAARADPPTAARSDKATPGDVPYRGWSSWSLQATTAAGYGKPWLTAARVVEQADAMRRELGGHGYVYVNVDSGWAAGHDAWGRPTPNPRRFPDGIAAVAAHLHANGQKLGLYLVPGVSGDVVRDNPVIRGTAVHVADVVAQPHRPATAWRTNLAIDYAKPGAQAYVDSVAAELADWGVDLLKFDGLTPGSDVPAGSGLDARADVAAMAGALRRAGRPIWLTLSWGLDPAAADVWQRYGNAYRVNGDVERYGPTLCGWEQVRRRFAAQAAWAGVAGVGRGWTDLDSLCVASGDLDGLTADEKQAAVTFWAICCSPLYAGGDLARLDDVGRRVLTDDAVLAVDAAGRPGRQVVGGPRPVWATDAADGSVVLALFNLDDRPGATSVRWGDLHLAGRRTVRDLWRGTDDGVADGAYRADLPPHACRLVRLGRP